MSTPDLLSFTSYIQDNYLDAFTLDNNQVTNKKEDNNQVANKKEDNNQVANKKEDNNIHPLEHMISPPNQVTKNIVTVTVIGVGIIVTLFLVSVLPKTWDVDPHVSPPTLPAIPTTSPTLSTSSPTISPINLVKPEPSQPGKTTNFEPLKKSLSSGDWVSADLNTDRLQPQSLSCSDLSSVNQLWLKYSNNRFGYSVQREIWEKESVKREYTTFGSLVGWLGKNYVAFSIADPHLITGPNALTEAPSGHLPFNGWQVNVATREGFGTFMKKLAQCRI